MATRRAATHVLVAGGGIAALEAALALRALAEERVTVELLAPSATFRYRPLAVTEPFGLGHVTPFELPVLVMATGATFMLGALASVDAERRLAQTSAGVTASYDILLIACGAVTGEAIPGALTYRGPADNVLISELLTDLEAGDVRKLVFAVPPGTAWSLPIYELALLTATWLTDRGIAGVELALVTPEDAPLRIFGGAASASVRELLADRNIVFHGAARPTAFSDGTLLLSSASTLAADRVVALPQLRGRQIAGVPRTPSGFIPVDAHGRVVGLPGVYAAGDVASFPVKQGGIAAQQADAAAEAIAAEAGADVVAHPFRPVLRGLLLTGTDVRYLRHDRASPTPSISSLDALWAPPAKIVGRFLGPFLGALAGLDTIHGLSSGPGIPSRQLASTGEDTEVEPRSGMGLGF